MKAKLFTLLTMASMATFTQTSCGDNNDDPGGGGSSSQLTVDKTEITINVSETSAIQITTSAEGTWSARTSSAWLTLSPESGVGTGTLNITCTDPGYREKHTDPAIYTSQVKWEHKASMHKSK